MDFFSVFLIAVGLSMDSLAVSVSGGIFMKPFRWSETMRLAFTMGFFQGGMTLLGWLLGVSFSSYIVAYDHWLAFTLLAFLGGKMIYESLREEENSFASLSTRTLLTLGLATSIDALAVGVSAAFLKVSIYFPAFFIGCTTFVLSLLGVCCGYRFGKIKRINVELLGGMILIAIGVKILVEHLAE